MVEITKTIKRDDYIYIRINEGGGGWNPSNFFIKKSLVCSLIPHYHRTWTEQPPQIPALPPIPTVPIMNPFIMRAGLSVIKTIK